MRLLLAEDERELSRALVTILEHNNYSVDAVFNGADALDWALTQNYGGIILDVMMPSMSGFEVLAALRRQGVQTPVLLLTARAAVDDRIEGLDLGADDYLTKPFAMGELLARIRAMTRRRPELSPSRLHFGDLALDRVTLELYCNDAAQRLGNKEYQILELLMEHPNRPMAAERLMGLIWSADSEADVSVVWVYISNLRKRLAAMGSHVTIRAIRGSGYTLEVSDED